MFKENILNGSVYTAVFVLYVVYIKRHNRMGKNIAGI